MTYARRFGALAAIVFFSLLNTGTSKQEEQGGGAAADTVQDTPQPPPTDVDRFCHRPAEGRCQSLRLSSGYAEEAEQLRCQQVGGTWDQTPCDTTNIVGRCVAQDRRSAWYFSPPEWTEPSARELCEAMGSMTWMTGTQ